MNQQPFKLFSINGYHKGKLTICRQPFSNEEFHKIKAWEADAIVTMTNKEEFEIDDFEKKMSICSVRWIHLPVKDFDTPTENINIIICELLDLLESNKRILIHCKGGQGRSGMIAMRLLVEQGLAPDSALNRIRKVRPLAVETEMQKDWASKRYCNKANQS